MLNIDNLIEISRDSNGIIENFKANKNYNLTQSSWSEIDNTVKSEISEKLLINQGFKCVYCERLLIGLGHEIDHFVHKGTYPQFSFHKENLFYSCRTCNSSARKGQKNTVKSPVKKNYNECTFLIIHPYYKNPHVEIIFQDEDRIYFDWYKCTEIGKSTINFFRWYDKTYTAIRSRTLIFERLNPLTSQEEKDLIQEAIAYKKK